jgi:hypothetical protein
MGSRQRAARHRAQIVGPGFALAAQQGVEPDCQQLRSIDLGRHLAAYCVDRVGTGQRCCQPVNADPLGRTHVTVADVEQINGASCVLACLESILRDIGDSRSQSDLFNQFPCECSAHCDDRGDGAVSRRHIPSLLLALDLGNEVRFGPALALLPEVARILDIGGFILLATRYDADGRRETHCVRVASIALGQCLVVMDPRPETLNPSTWSWAEFEQRECDAIAIWSSSTHPSRRAA